MGFDDCHAYLRAVSFEFAHPKPESELKPMTTAQLQHDDGRVDRYVFLILPQKILSSTIFLIV